MKLSEAIREGCKYGPQVYGSLTGDGEVGSCALGSGIHAMLGRGGPIYVSEKVKFYGSFKTIFDSTVDAPCGCEHFSLENCKTVRCLWCCIAHLNNEHRWTREAISEFVEVIERKLGLWKDPTPEQEAELVAEVEAKYAQDAIHNRPLEIG